VTIEPRHDLNPDRAFRERRAALAAGLGDRRALIAAGTARPRNYAANAYPYRASSHFLYLFGLREKDAIALYDGGQWILHLTTRDADDALWEGPRPSFEQIADTTGCAVRPLRDLEADRPTSTTGLREAATLPAPDLETCAVQSRLLGRAIRPGAFEARDEALAAAIIALRLCHDAAAITVAYGSIVTSHGEVLHNEQHHHLLGADDLVLADVGAESPGGWAGDVTRCWPVAARFSAPQRDLYQVVLDAQRQAVAAVAPGVRYRDIHLLASRALAVGLIDVGLLRGDADELCADGVTALFFPHGVGHLLGLDVHDMEDLGDRAGYGPGRQRSDAPGMRYLRLDRDLTPGMALTIEPGIYFIPAILNDPGFDTRVAGRVNRARLETFVRAGARGIRIEDDVLVTTGGHEVLSAAVPKTTDEVEAAMGGETLNAPEAPA
jgi:Xaa-Pro aminopeptidase